MKFPEKYRKDGNIGENGIFCWSHINGHAIFCISSNGIGWEHVSVSIKKIKHKKLLSESNRCPTWVEMCDVKSKFWDNEEHVMQLHPPKSELISTHPYVLHLWKPIGIDIPMPPQILVGIPGDNIQKF